MSSQLLTYLIITIGILNLIRMLFYLVGSDIYYLKQLKIKRSKHSRRWHTPSISVLVPAHNEEGTIIGCLKSLHASDYPQTKLEIIIIDDGSTDKTAQLVRQFIKEHGDSFFTKLVTQKNSGKATALNRGIKNHSNGRIIMCLDADSMVNEMTIRNAAQYFRDRKIVAVASNVNIIENNTLLALVQRFEYIVCYNMKKAQSQFNIEYIVGGIGSFFRKSVLEMVNYYDTNTMTEDIDLTMKVVDRGNKQNRIVFAYDSITYTMPAATFKSLIRQRFRWKYGRLQTFFKNKHLFFNTKKQYTKALTTFIMPFALVQELIFALEPVFLGYILYISIRNEDVSTVLLSAVVILFYISINIWSTKQLSLLQKIRLSVFAPPVYFLLYIVAFAEYASLILSALRLHKLPSSLKNSHTVWKSPERSQG